MVKGAKITKKQARSEHSEADDGGDATGSGQVKKSVPAAIPEAGETPPSDSHADSEMEVEAAAEVFTRQTHFFVKKLLVETLVSPPGLCGCMLSV